MARPRIVERGATLAALLFLAPLLAPVFGPREARAAGDDAASARAAVAPGIEWRAGRVDTTFAAPFDSLRLELGRRWIDASRVELRWIAEDGRESPPLIRGVDFLLDPRRGTVRLLVEPPPGVDLRARAEHFPLSAEPTFWLHRPWFPPDSLRGEPSVAAEERRGGSPLGDARLEIAGSKTFSVQVGSQQDLSLEQSLDLSVQGRVGRNVAVRAVLTDRDTPLQPEGTSAELQDLDRVLVEVEGPRARMRLGDFELVSRPSPFTDYRRQLSGVEGYVDTGPARVLAAGATSPGEFVSLEFLGQEGVQGPYALQVDRTRRADPIVAGSETVWLDGAELRRGESLDYIIDYAAGELTFTSRRVITAYSRIAVDFQVADRPYEGRVYRAGVESGPLAALLASRGTWTAGGSVVPAATGVPASASSPGSPSRPAPSPTQSSSSPPPEPRWRTAAAFDWLVERDAADEPLGVALTDEEKALLRESGDQADTLSPGVTYVGPGNGDYELVSVDTLAAPFWVHRGAGGGDYDVRFSFVGEGNGDYVDSTAAEVRFFVFVGRKEGDHLPVRDLVAPESRAVYALRSAQGYGRRWSLVTDLAVSDHDANTLSPRDDGNNLGTAVESSSRLDLLSAGPTELGLDLTFRNVDGRFEPLGRLEPSFFGLDWNLDPARLSSGDRRFLAAARGRHGRQSLRVELGQLDNTSDFRSRRAVVQAAGGYGPVAVEGRVLRAASEDERRMAGDRRGARGNDRLQATWTGAWVTSQLRYAAERSETGEGESRAGTRYHEWGGRLGTGAAAGAVQAAVEYAIRETRDIEGVGAPLRDTGRSLGGEVSWSGDYGRSVQLHYTRRTLDPAAGGAAQESELGRLGWLFRDGAGLWRQEGRWELSTREDRERIRTIEFVGEGEGHYDSLGVYQGVGDYEVIVRDSEDPVRRNRIDASFRTEIDRAAGADGEAGSLGARAWRELRLVHYWTAGVETGRDAAFLWSRMVPVLLGARSLERVDVLQRADLTTLDGARFFAPRLGFLDRRIESGSSTGVFERTTERTWTLRLRSRPTAIWSADVEGELERERRRISAAGGASAGGWDTRSLATEHAVRVLAALSLEVEASVRRRDRIASAERADVVQGSPAVIWTPQPRSRIEARTERTSVVRRGGTGRASRELERSGWSSRMVATVRLREALDLSAFLRETRPDGGTTVRDFRLELRATF